MIKIYKMKIKILLLSFIFIFFAVKISALPISEKRLTVYATTANISSIVSEICREKVRVRNLIPSTICPESYDIDAKTVKEISNSNAVLYHSWQPWVKNLKYKISKFGIVYREMRTEGNFMVPEINLKAAKEIADVFGVWDGDNKAFYEKNFLKYKEKIDFLSEEIIKNNPEFKGIKIVCNDKIAPFMEWLGFDVFAKYEKSSNISSGEMLALAKKIKEENIKYVVDNLQVGTEVGRTLAESLNLTHIVISNFTLANSYTNTLKNNIEKIVKAVKP